MAEWLKSVTHYIYYCQDLSFLLFFYRSPPVFLPFVSLCVWHSVYIHLCLISWLPVTSCFLLFLIISHNLFYSNPSLYSVTCHISHVHNKSYFPAVSCVYSACVWPIPSTPTTSFWISLLSAYDQLFYIVSTVISPPEHVSYVRGMIPLVREFLSDNLALAGHAQGGPLLSTASVPWLFDFLLSEYSCALKQLRQWKKAVIALCFWERVLRHPPRIALLCPRWRSVEDPIRCIA